MIILNAISEKYSYSVLNVGDGVQVVQTLATVLTVLGEIEVTAGCHAHQFLEQE